jgi:hypothetical protein
VPASCLITGDRSHCLMPAAQSVSATRPVSSRFRTMAAIVAYTVASALLVTIAAQGDLEQKISADMTRSLETHAPLLAFAVIAVLFAALSTLVARTGHDDTTRHRGIRQTSILALAIATVALAAFVNVYTQAFLLGWPSASDTSPWWSNAILSTYTTSG